MPNIAKLKTTKILITIPVNLLRRIERQAKRDGCLRSVNSRKPNVSKWLLLTAATAIDDDLAQGMIPHAGPGRRWE